MEIQTVCIAIRTELLRSNFTMQEMISINLDHMKEIFRDDLDFNEQEALDIFNSFSPKLKRWTR